MTRKGPLRDPQSYDVGYKKPPAEHRIKAGEVRNPKGRRKADKTMGDLVRDTLRESITVVENNKQRRLTVLAIALRKVANDAIRGELKAAKLLFDLATKYGDLSTPEADAENLSAEDAAILARYLPPEIEKAPEWPADQAAAASSPDHDITPPEPKGPEATEEARPTAKKETAHDR
jgi:hypothetical protein